MANAPQNYQHPTARWQASRRGGKAPSSKSGYQVVNSAASVFLVCGKVLRGGEFNMSEFSYGRPRVRHDRILAVSPWVAILLSAALFGCSEPASTDADTQAAAPNEAAAQQAAADDPGPVAPASPKSPPQPSAETVTEADADDDGLHSQIVTLRTDDPSVAILRAT